jgi:hypothetical protein
VCPLKSPRWWTVASRLGLLIGGLLVGLFLGELAARVIRPAGNSDLLFNSPDASPPGLYQRDTALLLVPTPGFQATARSLGYAVPIRINRLGMRGPEPEAVAEVARWLTIGDSFTFSIQVPEEQTFIGRLSAERKEHFWNAGVDGYSTWQALDRYKGLRSSSGSSAVLLLFFLGNDLQDNERWPIQKAEMDRPPPAPPAGATRTAGGPPRPPEIRQGPPPLQWWKSILLKNSYLYAHLRVWSRARELATGRDPSIQRWGDELSIYTRSGAPRLAALIQKSEAPLRALAEEAARNGDQLLVAVAPPAFVVDQRRVEPTFKVVGLDPATATLDAPALAVWELLKRTGISACDLTLALRAGQESASTRGDAMYLTYDGHWTQAGHAVVAEELQRCLQR